jgi:serine/threonine-protein kinase HipA
MAIGSDGYRSSRLDGCLQASEIYLLSRRDAREIIDQQLDVITTQWSDAADTARLTPAERRQLWGRQILNPYALEGYVTGS